MAITFKWRRGTASAWTSANPTLNAGEPGFETDTGYLKVGNGSSVWTALTYVVGAATTAVKGIVQLTDSTSSTSTTTAATPNSVKTAYDTAAAKPSLSTATPQAVGTAAAGSGSAASKDDHVHAVVSPTATGSTGARLITVSTSDPSGGADGDVWVKYQ